MPILSERSNICCAGVANVKSKSACPKHARGRRSFSIASSCACPTLRLASISITHWQLNPPELGSCLVLLVFYGATLILDLGAFSCPGSWSLNMSWVAFKFSWCLLSVDVLGCLCLLLVLSLVLGFLSICSSSLDCISEVVLL